MKKLRNIAMLMVGMSTLVGCSDLNEKILDEYNAAGLTDKQAADGMIAPVYAVLPTIFQHTTLFALQEISTDEAILPYRGGTDWGDNGIYLSLHKHETTSTDPNVRNTWNAVLAGISRSVTAINSLKTNKDANANLYIAEARGMRAYYNMVMLDLFGVAFSKEDLGDVTSILRGEAAITYIKNELLAVEPLVGTSTGPGRLTKGAVWSLLARLYLNSAVWRDPYGTPTFKAEDMDKVVEYSDKVINSGQYALSTDYWDIFSNVNHTNKELIFAVDQRAELNGHNRMSYFSLANDQRPLPAYPAANGTDGPAITPTFYQSWVAAYGSVDPAEADPRFYKQNVKKEEGQCVDPISYKIDRGILRGQQFGLIYKSGAFVKCTDGKSLQVGKIVNTRGKGNPMVIHTEQVDFTTVGSDYSAGYRVEKYEFSDKSSSGRNFGEADIMIVRLADVYLMRAEAKLRKSNDAAAALADVNKVRLSRTSNIPATALSSINLDLLLRERGFEFYWELQRRTDLIRFNKYEDSWTEKTNTDKTKRLFPIPQTAIDGASNLPGYLKQNQGY
ncbi:MAG: RagB/SusD family nutrient uptake outer membrane protein [Aquirufa sp.]